MESSPNSENASRSLDPDLLAALTKLADGCDGLRRWALTTGSKNSTHDPAGSIDAIDMSTSQMENITKAINPAHTTQIEDRPAEDNKGDDVPANRSLAGCSTDSVHQDPGSGAESCDPSSSVDEASRRSKSTDTVSDPDLYLLRDLHQDKKQTQEMMEAFLRGMEEGHPDWPKLLLGGWLNGLPTADWACARNEIERAWPQDRTSWLPKTTGQSHFISRRGAYLCTNSNDSYGNPTRMSYKHDNQPLAMRNW